jgi:hypothetical protein
MDKVKVSVSINLTTDPDKMDYEYAIDFDHIEQCNYLKKRIMEFQKEVIPVKHQVL